MIQMKARRASLCCFLLQLLLFLHLLHFQQAAVSALSINSPSGTKGANQQQQQQQQQARSMQLPAAYSSSGGGQQTTITPPLMTTIAQNNYIDSVASQLQGKQQYQPIHMNLYPPASGGGGGGGDQQQRSANPEEHDDTVPLATINNHSRNNQPPARPAQYVDVAALVGRDRNSGNLSLTSGASGAQTGLSQSMAGASGAGGLTAKSRSGLPECATQQVCNAIFVRMNYTQRLCECSSNYNWKCSHNLDPQDGHTIELTRKFDKRIYTQIKTCEPLREVRACKSPTDWTLLALQSERSGKAHYVVVCKCPTWAQLEGPYTHNHPPYANIPGIRVYGMLCAHQTARSSAQTYAAYNPALSIFPDFPWSEALNVLNTTNLLAKLDAAH